MAVATGIASVFVFSPQVSDAMEGVPFLIFIVMCESCLPPATLEFRCLLYSLTSLHERPCLGMYVCGILHECSSCFAAIILEPILGENLKKAVMTAVGGIVGGGLGMAAAISTESASWKTMDGVGGATWVRKYITTSSCSRHLPSHHSLHKCARHSENCVIIFCRYRAL